MSPVKPCPRDRESTPMIPTDASAPDRPTAEDALLLSALRDDEALTRLLRLLARLLDVAVAGVWVPDADGQEDAQWLAAVTAPPGPPGPTAPPGAALCALSRTQDGLLLIEDAQTDPRLAAEPPLPGAPPLSFCAALPLRGSDTRRLGTLWVMDPRPRALDAAGRADLDAIRALLEDQLRLHGEAARDRLTGTWTRRFFAETADREWRRSMRGLVPISVIVAALDGLPGFAAGAGADALARSLRAVGLALQYSLHRPGDCACRWDATRFAVLLPGTDEPGAVETAERLRIAVGALQIPYADSPMGVLTLSQGLETLPADALARVGTDEAIASAADALALAQAEGGNRWRLGPTAAARWQRLHAPPGWQPGSGPGSGPG